MKGGTKNVFLKNNKYKDSVVAALWIVVFSILAFKLFGYLDDITSTLGKIISLSMSFIYGIIIAYVLNPIVKIIESKTKMRRSLAIAVTYILFITIIAIISIYGIPSLIDSIRDMINKVPGYIDSAQRFLNDIVSNDNINGLINSTGTLGTIQSYIEKIGYVLMNLLEGSFNTLFNLSSQLVKVVLGFLVSIYVLSDKDKLINDWKRVLVLVLKEKRAKQVIEFGRIYNNMIGTYIGIKAIDSTIIGIMAFILLTIVKSEYALLLSIIVGITNMIPYFGPFIGEIVGFLINIFVSPTKGLVVFLTLFALQMFDGWYLDPKLIGSKVGVRPFWIIYAVVIGGGFFGPIGMLLASPTAATMKFYYSKLLEKNKEVIKNIEKV